ncbi:SDR family NAD(P)-dependent oxidoreductase [Deinococcus aestuarii]|uniref:SDR family NAD(P)-dependent oxidoreductase n=1 Tax=Deinococcus aestuarii TaxID=2774531 RepID=UPI001C0D8468|nr:SDR family NAD(P)-dependent oxidoreductase [Deinococcus aestuarii]
MSRGEAGPLHGQRVVVTGGSGILGRVMALALAEDGATVHVGGRSAESSERAIAEVLEGHPNRADLQGRLKPLVFDVLDPASMHSAAAEVDAAGGTDILINAAGGNVPSASTTPETTFFDVDLKAVERVIDLNLVGTVAATQAFARGMCERGQGVIVNVSSMSAVRPLTRVLGYSASKAAVDNFTQWLAVNLAQQYGRGLRVNAVAPGFFLTEQNRYLMLNEDGSPTPRAQSVLAHTPQGRFGEPGDLVSTLRWLVSPHSAFVTGIVVPVDGGFSAFAGV